MNELIPNERIEKAILLIRGHKVMLDTNLAKLYGVTTFNLNKAVKRNLDRFPGDFMLQLDFQEVRSLIFQFGISKTVTGTIQNGASPRLTAGFAGRRPRRSAGRRLARVIPSPSAWSGRCAGASHHPHT